MAFTHLHSHTEYSILDSTNKIREYVKRVKELGMDSAAITDHGVMYGVIQFYKAMKEEGLRPILGCEVYVAPGTRFEKDEKNRYSHLVILAENNTGYENLMKLVSEGFKAGYYFKPRVDHELLEQYHEGLIALSACVAGEVPKEICKGNYEKAKELALYYEKVFGEGNFYLELQDHGLADEQKIIPALLSMSKETGIPLVATNDCHYTMPEDYISQEMLWCIRDKKSIHVPHNCLGAGYHVASEQEMKEKFPYALQAIENSQKIAERCNVEIEFHNTKMPAYEVPKGDTTWTYLNKLCYEGLKVRYPKDSEKHTKQLEYELSVIKEMGYVEYFLIVWDFINWARKHDIPVGPGRGSAAGSLVAYTTGITDIDPVRYNLLFERFLNPERVSMPDIDVDFCMERRQEVIDYVCEKYGTECVAQIITFGTMAARQVIKDVGKAMEMSFSRTNEIASWIPKEPGITLAAALEKSPEFRQDYDSDVEIKALVDTCMKLEGLPRQTGMHAAGVIICDKPVEKYIPTTRAADGMGILSQFTMTEVEELGLLKMDFLGLRTLTAIEYAKKNIEQSYGIEVDMHKIDYNDKNVLEFLSKGKVTGVFQLESEGMQNFMRELKPQSIEDLIAGISLYRPGPIDFIPNYINGKNNPSAIIYDCPQMKPILEPTYGCIVYQEQVMQIVRDLGGYTMGRSDLVRRAMSKKKASVMEKERQNFVYGNLEEGVPGCVANGIDEKVANKIYDDMTDFAKYAFNKSHAAAYAIISYQTAWLKYYYPKEYMAAVMTTVIDNSEKLSGYIACAKAEGIKLYSPDINTSVERFTVKTDGILFALAGISGCSTITAEHIIENRKKGYHTFGDAINGMRVVGADRSCIENLIKAGAFDCFGGNRKQYLSVLENALKTIRKKEKKNIDGQMNLFELDETTEAQDFFKYITLPDISEMNQIELLKMEKEVCGVYVSAHPLDQYYSFMKAVGTMRTTDVPENRTNIICGMVKNVKKITAKSGKMMAFFTIEDLYGSLNCIAFPSNYLKYHELLKEDELLVLTGTLMDEEKEKRSFSCKEAVRFTDIATNVWIQFKNKEEYEETIAIISRIVKSAENGVDELRIYLKNCRSYMTFSRGKYTEEKFLNRLRTIFGEENVALKVVGMH